ncbi:hypothetical protein EWM64_g8473 [Hericium alpestre]|uniref:FAD-binding domain-containing protein n=1 Tax=Hericium alpestre TaxID=135208 RepID=A0A4Y9ZMS3_9AGAM|nr:hypothetical protein EWM64_g8473 [Hericium alpestre]
MSTSVLIVGFGPTGLISALPLAQNGVDVRVIEKLPHSQSASGAPPRSLEIERHASVLDDVRKADITTADSYKYDNGKIVKEFLVVDFQGPTPEYIEHWHRFSDAPGDAIMLRPTDRTATENVYFLSRCGMTFDHKRALLDHDYLRELIYGVAKPPDL